MTEDEIASKALAGLRAQFNPLEREKIAELKKLLKSQEREISTLHKSLGMRRALAEVSTPRQVRVALGKDKPAKSFQLILSDTHSMEIVTKANTNGRNVHNFEIGRERIRSVILQAVRLMKQEARSCNPVHLTVWLGGDFTTNADLHYKSERTVPEEPLVEMQSIYEMLHEELDILWRKVPTNSNSAVCSFSNHGRDSKDIIPGLEAERSYDTVTYRRLALDFPSVKFDIASVTWTVEDVCGFKTLYTHGHSRGCAIRRTPDGIVLPNWNFIRDMRVSHGFDSWVQGHRHTHCVLNGNNFTHVQNGSLVGENSYSASLGYPGESPSQCLVVVDLKHRTVEKVIRIIPEG